MQYSEYLRGKRVVFVGACPNIRGRGNGERIDSFDVVVRSCGAVGLLGGSDYRRDYGGRCDVLYVNNQYYREMSPLPADDYKNKGIKYLCMKSCKENDRMRMSKSVTVRLIYKSMIEVRKKVRTATMGLFIVNDILMAKPAELFITGIDFFASKKPVFEPGNYGEYVPGYLPGAIVEQGNRINSGKKEDAHNFFENAKYFYDLFAKHQNFKTDDFIYELLVKIIRREVQQGDVVWQ